MKDGPIISTPPKDLKYPPGSLLFDVRYYKKPECFEVIYWDPITQQLELKYEPAIVDIWFLKKENRTNKYQIAQAPMDNLYPFYCKPSDIPRVIAQEIGGEWAEKFNNNFDPDGYMYNNELSKMMCECPWVFKADFEPSVYYRLRWLNKYGTDVDISKVSQCFLDIETDVIDRSIDPSDYTQAPQPINAVTLILPQQKIAAMLVLGPRPKNRIDQRFYNLLEIQQRDFNDTVAHMDDFIEELRSDEDNKQYIDGFDIRVHVFDYDKEIILIKTIFDYINKYRPWFVEAWNAPFDFNYIWNRIKYLGYDPCDLMIPEKFRTKKIKFIQDKNPEAVIKTSRDWFEMSSYSQWICQMRTFAAIRKSQSERRTYKLDAIGREVAGIGKANKFTAELAYKNIRDFWKYNFGDVVVQVGIEKKTGDSGTFYSRSYVYATGFSKCFQETHIVRNTREYYYENNSHFVQACRLIVDKSVDGSFMGAFVADPAKNAPTGLILNGKNTNNIIYGAVDADAESYYPSSKMGLNLDPMSLLYKLHINNNYFKNGTCINRSMNQAYIWTDAKSNPHDVDMSGPIVNAFKNKSYLSLMTTWFSVPTVTEVISYIDEKLGFIGGAV